AAVVVALVRLRTAGRGEQSPGAAGRPSARQILDERFARGEIDADEYQQRVRQLEDR
ncbi:SHOCT domain-containing protein, partial [Rhodococcus ruber]|nr:SHOCT domain-containing protein [Rhodococcus ruber]